MLTTAVSRKIQIVSMLHDLNFRLQLLNQKRMNLASTGMIIADGNIAPDEIQGSNFYVQNGLAGAINMANGMGYSTGMQMTWRNQNNPYSVSIHDYAKQQVQAQLASQEKVIDMQAKQIESKITMYTNELQSVQKLEEQAGKMATPKYTGVA